MEYVLYLLTLIVIYIILSVSLNLILGYGGIASLVHAGFMGTGAYVTALLSIHLGCNYLVQIIGSLVFAFIVSGLVGFPAFRVKGHYYIVASFGLQIILQSIMMNWLGLTHGPMGIPGISRPAILGIEITTNLRFFIFSLIIMVLCILFCWRIVSSSIGVVLRAIREDEVATCSLGKNVVRYKSFVFATGCAMAAIAGSLYATYMGFIDPSTFTIDESIFVITLVVVGGSGNIKGSIVGAILLVVLPEGLRFLNLPSTVAAPMRQIIYGLLLIIFMRYMPLGILREYKI